MPTVYWEGDRIFQSVGGRRAELGYIRHDDTRGKFVLVLNGESLGLSSGLRYPGDEWNTLKEAKQKAAGCAAATLAHHVWMMHDERAVYIEVIFIILENPKVQMSPEQIEEIKAGVKDAPLDKLREAVGLLRTASRIDEIALWLQELFGVGGAS